MAEPQNTLKYAEINNLASLGQFGVRQLATGDTSTTGEKFMAVYANVDSDFTVASTSGGDASFTVKLLAGGSLVGPYKNITGLTGDILCFKSDEL
jgi:hypothetical protein